MAKAKNLPVKWSAPKEFSIPEKYSVPFPYSIPEDYSVPEVFEGATTETTATTEPQNPQNKFQIDPLTASLITASMVGLFGGVIIGQMNKKKRERR